MSERPIGMPLLWAGAVVALGGLFALWALQPVRSPDPPFTQVVEHLPPPPEAPTIVPHTPGQACTGDPMPWARAAVAAEGGRVRDAGVLPGPDGAAAGHWVAVEHPRGAVVLVSGGGPCWKLVSLAHRPPEAAQGSRGGLGDPRHPCLGVDILGGTSATTCFAWERERPVVALTSAASRDARTVEDWRDLTWTDRNGDAERHGRLIAVPGTQRATLGRGSIDVEATEADGVITVRFTPTDLPAGLDIGAPGARTERVGDATVVTLPVDGCPRAGEACDWPLEAASGDAAVSFRARRHADTSWPPAEGALTPVTTLAP